MEQAITGNLGWHAAMLLDEVGVAWFARAVDVYGHLLVAQLLEVVAHYHT